MRALALLLAAAACRAAPAKTAPRYNVIMISLGNVGAAHMSLYGYARKTTPSLDRWAGQAVVFENAFSPASWTLPVGTSLFTSLYPYAHGVTARTARNTLNEKVATLPELLRRAGYATAAFTGGLDYYKGWGHMRGFETAPDNPDFTGFGTTLPQARRWLSQHEREPFLLFVHGYDAHCPFAAPGKPFSGTFGRAEPGAPPSRGRCLRGVKDSLDDRVIESSRCELDRATLECKPAPRPRDDEAFALKPAELDRLRDLYDEDVLSVDAQVGAFLESLSAETRARTIVVVYCEHGELFAKNGIFGRPGTTRGVFYDEVLHVPLLIRLPGASGRRVRSLVELTDVMPTLLAALGLPREGLSLQGKDLGPLLAGKDEPVHERVYAGAPFDHGKPGARAKLCSAARDGDWKLISEEVLPKDYVEGRQPEPAGVVVDRLYSVSKDPDERDDLAAARPDVVARLKSDVERWRAGCLRLLAQRPPSTNAVPAALIRSAQERGYW